MKETDNPKDFLQQMPPSMLKIFTFLLFPLSIFGQLVVIISQFKAGLSVKGFLGLPNWGTILCSLVAICVFVFTAFRSWKALKAGKIETPNKKGLDGRHSPPNHP